MILKTQRYNGRIQLQALKKWMGQALSQGRFFDIILNTQNQDLQDTDYNMRNQELASYIQAQG